MSRNRTLIAIVAGVVALNLVLELIGSLSGGAPGGPRSSTYATGEDGAAAYGQLLRESGVEVETLRRPPAEVRLDPRETLVLLDALGVTTADVRAIGEFVSNGGRLVVGGSGSRWLAELDAEAPIWSTRGVETARPVVPVAETLDVSTVAAGAFGSWDDPGASLPVLMNGERTLLAIRALGKGTIVLLADASPLHNGYLDRADNAALSLRLVGTSSRVRFAESYHGYGEATGLRAVPGRWWVALGLALAAISAFMVMRGRRFGPPEPDTRQLAPARVEYVSSLAATLAKRRDRRSAAAALVARMERRHAIVGGLVEHAAASDRVTTDAELVTLGGTFAEFERSTRRR